jgi:hypothetical protein
VAVVLVLVLGWLVVVSPEREKAASLNQQVAAARTQLATANGQAAAARGAQARYDAAYASIVSLGKAVPPSEEVSSLIYQLAQASQEKHVEFTAIAPGGGGAGTAGGASATAVASASGFTALPFTFSFDGTFPDLHGLLRQLDRSTVITSSGRLVVSGRLLTIQSVKLTPLAATGSGTGSGAHAEELSGSITATAYVLPATASLTSGVTPGAAGTGAGQTPASSSGSSSTPTAPAIARVTP